MAKTYKEIDLGLVRSFVEYEPGSGIFTWKHRPKELFAVEDKKKQFGSYARWNAAFAGKTCGSMNNCGYIMIAIRQSKIPAHRVAWAIMTGEWPSELIDHINGVRDDNRFCNLRAASFSQNKQNEKTRSDNITGLKGVCYRKDSGKFRSSITINKNRILLGTFNSPGAAKAAYDASADRLFGEYARLR